MTWHLNHINPSHVIRIFESNVSLKERWMLEISQNTDTDMRHKNNQSIHFILERIAKYRNDPFWIWFMELLIACLKARLYKIYPILQIFSCAIKNYTKPTHFMINVKSRTRTRLFSTSVIIHNENYTFNIFKF